MARHNSDRKERLKMAYNQVVEFNFGKFKKYCLWYSKDMDGFFASNGSIRAYDSEAIARKQAAKSKVKLDKEPVRYNIAAIQEWIAGDDLTVDHALILGFWNIFQDAAVSVKAEYLGEQRDEETDDLYNKLFRAHNYFIEDGVQPFVPVWSPEEVARIKKILADGVRILKKATSVR